MNWDRPIRTRRLTPEEVLEGLRDIFVRTTGMPWEVAVAEVTFDAPLDDLAAIDGFDAPVVELYFGTGKLPPEWWIKLAEFGTIRGLCHALAQFVEVPAVEPVEVFGKPCPATGAFLVVRQLLVEAGADVSELRPSSPLVPYVWLWPDVFRWQVPRLAPGRVPEVVFRNTRLVRRVIGVLFGLAGALVGMWAAKGGFPVVGGFLAGVGAKVLLIDLLLAPAAARRRNWSVRFGELYDFQDLARLIASAPEGDRAAA